MSSHRTRTRLAATLLATVSLLGGACSGDDDDRGDGANPTVEGSGSPSTTAPEASASTTTTGTTTTSARQALADVRVTLVEVARLDSPIAVAVRSGSDSLWVAERGGQVRRLDPAGDGYSVADEVVLDISDQTTPDGERGLLGLTFSADGETLVASYTDRDGNTRVVAYAMDGDRADPSSSVVLLALAQPYPNHNGGNVVLGPDGDIWLGLGDGGSGGDPENRAQDPDDLLGKIVRLDLDEPGAEPEIVVTGVRNPWRFSFDPATGDLWVADVGQNRIEEVDHLPAGSIEGANLGWSAFEGSERYDPSREAVGGRLVDPVFEVSHDDGWCSITGGVVVRGEALAPLDGAYLFSDYCKGGLNALRVAGGEVTETAVLVEETDGQVASINVGPGGEVLVLSLNGTISRLQR